MKAAITTLILLFLSLFFLPVENTHQSLDYPPRPITYLRHAPLFALDKNDSIRTDLLLTGWFAILILVGSIATLTR